MDSSINREYKDRFFRFLFGTEERKDNLLSLYNALNNSQYKDAGDLEFTTIQDFIYMGYKNDVSFLVEDYMNLYEHQSSFNPNMPLRGLLYYTSLFDRYIENHSLNIYSSKPVKIPTPHYVVFYNGDKEMPDRSQLKLSDLFINPSREDDCYEWTATMLNINLEHNQQLMEKCRPLWEYAYFIAKVKAFKQTMTIREAVDAAVTACITDDVLAHILTEHRMEVTEMIMTDYDEVKVRKMFVEEGRQEGRQEGEQIGRLKERQRSEKANLEIARQMLKYVAPDIVSKQFGIPIEKLTEHIQ